MEFVIVRIRYNVNYNSKPYYSNYSLNSFLNNCQYWTNSATIIRASSGPREFISTSEQVQERERINFISDLVTG